MSHKTLLLVISALLSTMAFGQTKIDKEDKIDFDLDLPQEKNWSLKDAIKVTDLYRKKRWNRHRRAGVFGKRYDAGSCWFAVKKLSDFQHVVDSVIAAARTKDVKNTTPVTGFRFYYILYEKHGRHTPPVLAQGKINAKKIHSLLIVATHIVNGIETDIVYTSKGGEEKLAAIEVSMTNEGTLCPPQPPKDCKGAILAKTVYNKKKK